MRSPSWARTMILAAAGSMSVVLSAGTPAMAHDELVSVTPGDGVTVDVAPREVVLEFSDAVEPIGTAVVVLGADGRVVSEGPPTITGGTVRQALLPLVADGTYRVSYRVVSADGHPVSGGTSFTGQGLGPIMTSVAGADPGNDAPGGSSATRATSSGYRGLVIAVGAGLLCVLVIAGARGLSRRGRVQRE